MSKKKSDRSRSQGFTFIRCIVSRLSSGADIAATHYRTVKGMNLHKLAVKVAQAVGLHSTMQGREGGVTGSEHWPQSTAAIPYEHRGRF